MLLAGSVASAIAAGEVDRAGVTRRRVVELIQSRHGEAESRTCRRGSRCADREVRRRSCAYRNRAAGPRDGTCHRVRRGYGLIAGRLERRAEGARAAGQSAVGRQYRAAIAAGEVNRAGVTGRRVVELIQRRHGEVES